MAGNKILIVEDETAIARMIAMPLGVANYETRIYSDGIEIPLKPMEFELLAVLAKNKNIAISRENLLRMVWGADYVGETCLACVGVLWMYGKRV